MRWGRAARYGRGMTVTRPPDGWLVPSPSQALEGSDRFVGADATVLDFWRWAFSDLRDNTQRGVLAEFLVALALGRTETRRKPWDNHDVTTASGLRVEVKASGYLQSWAQRTHSQLSFGRVIGRTWDANTNEFYVVAAERVRECAYKSVSIAWVRKHAKPVSFSDLAATIERVGRGVTTVASA